MIRVKRFTAIICLVLPAVANLAGATIETFDFSGTISTVQDKCNMLDGIGKGTDFKGTYWIDTEKIKEIQQTLNPKTSYTYCLFEGDEQAFGMEVVIGDRLYTSGTQQNSRITSSFNKTNESYTIYAYADTGSSNLIEYLALSFSGRNNALGLNSDPLLLDGVDIDDKDISTSMTYLDYHRSSDGRSYTYGYASGSLGSFNCVSGKATPEPGTLAVLVLGGGVILFRRTRNKYVTV